MDIREIDGLWCDDITFCQEKCDMRDCPRNQCNIRDHNIPHSFSVERPKDCPKEKVMPDRDKLMLTREAICSGLNTIKSAYERCEEDHNIVYFVGEYGTGQVAQRVSVPTLLSDAIELLQSQPQIVRCKYCKHYVHVRNDAAGYCTKDSSCWVFRDLDWFCADGERR